MQYFKSHSFPIGKSRSMSHELFSQDQKEESKLLFIMDKYDKYVFSIECIGVCSVKGK